MVSRSLDCAVDPTPPCRQTEGRNPQPSAAFTAVQGRDPPTILLCLAC